MKISKFGGMIGIGAKTHELSMQPLGDTTALKRIVTSMQQVGVFPIVVLYEEGQEEVRHHLSSKGVVFLSVEKGGEELFSIVKKELQFLQDCCEKIIYTPVHTPFFSISTLLNLINAQGDVLSPSYHGKSGHPIVIDTKLVDGIINYTGRKGLRDAVHQLKTERRFINVEDKGVLYYLRENGAFMEYLSTNPKETISLFSEWKIKKEEVIFDSRGKLLLFLIWKTQSVKTACYHMAISYSKAWVILNTLEDTMGVKMIHRRHGGAYGGTTTLTEQGLYFMKKFQELEEEMIGYVDEKFKELKKVLE